MPRLRSLVVLSAALALVSCETADRPVEVGSQRSALSGNLELSTDAPSYARFFDSITVTWANAPSTATWVSLMKAGSANNAFLGNQYSKNITNIADGTHTFPPLEIGNYVVRCLTSNYTILEEIPFTARAGTMAATKSTYTYSEEVVIDWDGVGYAQQDLIVIAPVGAPVPTVSSKRS